MKRFLSILILLSFAACGTVDFDQISDSGFFRGKLLVMWIGEGNPHAGDGAFIFVPHPDDPLILTRPDGSEIQPGLMYTDGGSIPRAGQVFRGFSPWGYAPAYMVHDWVFLARQCLNQNSTNPNYAKLDHLTFQDSATIMAEAIKALIRSGRVGKDDVAPRVISGVVSGPVSYSAWTTTTGCREVSDKDRDSALASFAPKPRTLRPASTGPTVQIISELSF